VSEAGLFLFGCGVGLLVVAGIVIELRECLADARAEEAIPDRAGSGAEARQREVA